MNTCAVQTLDEIYIGLEFITYRSRQLLKLIKSHSLHHLFHYMDSFIISVHVTYTSINAFMISVKLAYLSFYFTGNVK